MALANVLSVQVRPDRVRSYQEICQKLAEKARQKQEAFRWTAHQTLIGAGGTMHFVNETTDFAGIAEQGPAQEMILRVLGEKEGGRFLEEAGACAVSQVQETSTERPELSYRTDEGGAPDPFAVVTVAIARPGHQEACEELIRKVAEALPKVGDPGQLQTYQTIVGNLSQYWTVRPLADLSDIDRMLPPLELLTQAFGAAEGGLIYRSGLDAMERLERSIVAYREDLSNPA